MNFKIDFDDGILDDATRPAPDNRLGREKR